MSSWKDFSSHIKSHGKKRSIEEEAHSSEERTQSTGRSGNSSFVELKAQLAQLHNSKATQSPSSATSKDSNSYLGKANRKLPAHLRPSPHVDRRSLKHDAHSTTTSAWSNTPLSSLEKERAAALERKVRLYEDLQRGTSAGLSEEQLSNLLVDWDRKEQHESDLSSRQSDGDEDDEDDEDNMTEYEDDFGRIRRVKRRDVPRHILQQKRRAQEELIDEDMVNYGPSTSFPVYNRESVHAPNKLYTRAAPDHFDAKFEKRHRGAGFYQFSQDERERQQQMEQLTEQRRQTETMRDSNDVVASSYKSLGDRRREQQREYVMQNLAKIKARQNSLLGTSAS